MTYTLVKVTSSGASLRSLSQLEKITIAPGLTFDALVAGEANASLVLLLHGCAQSMHCARAQLPALAAAGYHADAHSRRRCSLGAPRDTRGSHSRAAGLAHRAVAAASERLQSRAANAGWRSGAPLAAPQSVSRT